MTSGYHQIDDRIIATAQIPAALLELARSQRLDLDVILRGTGIFPEDLNNWAHSISSRKWLQLFHNIMKQDGSGELPLRFGKRLPYICHSYLLQALMNAASIRDLLEILRNHCRLYYPGCFFHLASNSEHHFLIFNDSIGCGRNRHLHYQLLMSSIVTLLKAGDIPKADVTFFLEQETPADTAPLHTYLGSRLKFHAPVTAMVIPDSLSHQPLNHSCEATKRNALEQCHALMESVSNKQGFIEALHKLLLHRLPRDETSLESCARAFGISPATFKRRLKQHDTSFQRELDNARKLLALSMLFVDGMSVEETAHRMHIHDNANFRRSFKRWTGSLPSALREQVLDF